MAYPAYNDVAAAAQAGGYSQALGYAFASLNGRIASASDAINLQNQAAGWLSQNGLGSNYLNILLGYLEANRGWPNGFWGGAGLAAWGINNGFLNSSGGPSGSNPTPGSFYQAATGAPSSSTVPVAAQTSNGFDLSTITDHPLIAIGGAAVVLYGLSRVLR